MLEKIYHKNLIKNLYHQKITENNTKNTYSRMTEIAKIEKILELIFSDTGKGYCEWEKKLISVEEANLKIIYLIKHLNRNIIDQEENHEIMIEIENKKLNL